MSYQEGKKQSFAFEQLCLTDAYVIDNFYIGDDRGGFTKIFEEGIYQNSGINFKLSEAFASVSARNVIRGIHFQTNSPQAKLVTVLSGKVIDYIVDLRVDSPNLKKWISIELSEDNHKALYVPRGFGHAFCSLEDNTIMLYMCDGKYDKESDSGIIYNDTDIAIEWPKLEGEIHSARDLTLMTYKEYLSMCNSDKNVRGAK